MVGDVLEEDAEGAVDALRLLGPLSTAEVRERSVEGASVEDWLTTLTDTRRVVQVRVAGEERWAVVEDVGRGGRGHGHAQCIGREGPGV